MLCVVLFFFVQAEDGIRVRLVTGVQTCALPIFLFPIHAFAVVWDISDDDLKKVAFELKKFNTHLENLKNTQIKSLQGQQEDLLRQIEEIKQILPQLLGTIDQNKQEILISIGRTNSKLADLEAEVKNQVLDEIHQQNKILQLFRQEQANLKEGLAQDRSEEHTSELQSQAYLVCRLLLEKKK